MLCRVVVATVPATRVTIIVAAVVAVVAGAADGEILGAGLAAVVLGTTGEGEILRAALEGRRVGAFAELLLALQLAAGD